MKESGIQKILVPVDFTETSKTATLMAITLAKQLKAEITLLNVIDFSAYSTFGAGYMTAIVPLPLEFEKEVKAKLNKIKESIIKNNGITPTTRIANGSVYGEIINFSKKNKTDLIVMGTHGASGLSEIFIGSNAQRVVTLSEISVITLQRQADQSGFKNILIPIDNALHSREKVDIAIIIAGLSSAKIHILALPLSKDKQELKSLKIKCDSVEEIIKANKLQYTSTTVFGKTLAKAAMDYASINKCDLIVINTGHESKINGILLGAFEQQIVNHSKIPVLSFKHSEGTYDIDTVGYGIG